MTRRELITYVIMRCNTYWNSWW